MERVTSRDVGLKSDNIVRYASVSRSCTRLILRTDTTYDVVAVIVAGTGGSSMFFFFRAVSGEPRSLVVSQSRRKDILSRLNVGRSVGRPIWSVLLRPKWTRRWEEKYATVLRPFLSQPFIRRCTYTLRQKIIRRGLFLSLSSRYLNDQNIEYVLIFHLSFVYISPKTTLLILNWYNVRRMRLLLVRLMKFRLGSQWINLRSFIVTKKRYRRIFIAGANSIFKVSTKLNTLKIVFKDPIKTIFHLCRRSAPATTFDQCLSDS